MGGAAVGDGELEQRFEPAGREAKASLINRQSANSENRPLPDPYRWSGEPIPVITARCGNLISVRVATGRWLVNGLDKTGPSLSGETYSLTCFLSPRRGHTLGGVIKIRNRHPLASGFKTEIGKVKCAAHSGLGGLWNSIPGKGSVLTFCI